MPKDFLLGITVFFWCSSVFWFLVSEAFIGYRAEKRLEEKNRKNPQKPKSCKKCSAQGFRPGDCVFVCFFFVLCFLVLFGIFLGFWTRKRSSGTGLRKKTKKLEGNQIEGNQKNKKHKALGEMLCPMISSSFVWCVFDVFWVFGS